MENKEVNKEVNSWENCDWLQRVAKMLTSKDFLEEIAGYCAERLHVIYADGAYKAVRESTNDDLEIRIETTGRLYRNKVQGIIRRPNELIRLPDICRAGTAPDLPVYRITVHYKEDDEKREKRIKLLGGAWFSAGSSYHPRIDVELEENGKRILIEDIELDFKFTGKYANTTTQITLSIETKLDWRYFPLDKESLVYEITKDGQKLTEDYVKGLYLRRMHPNLMKIAERIDDTVEFKSLGKTVTFDIKTLRETLGPYYT